MKVVSLYMHQKQSFGKNIHHCHHCGQLFVVSVSVANRELGKQHTCDFCYHKGLQSLKYG